MRDESPNLRSQWAADIAAMRGECGASCACRRLNAKKPIFVLPKK
jgi:hypothetical protein